MSDTMTPEQLAEAGVSVFMRWDVSARRYRVADIFVEDKPVMEVRPDDMSDGELSVNVYIDATRIARERKGGG